MARRFTGASSDRILIGSAGLNGWQFQYGTVAVCGYLVSHTTYGAYLSVNPAPGPTGANTEISVTDTGGVLAWYDSVTPDEKVGATALTNGDSAIKVWTKATGAVAPRVHFYRFTTGTWVHQAASSGGGGIANAATATSIIIGAYDNASSSDALDEEVWAIATWNKVVFTDSEVERLARGNWLNLAPDFYEQWSDGREVGDMPRTLGRYPARQTARTGTTRGAQKPPPGFRMDARRHRR